MARCGPRKTMKVVSPRATVFTLSATFILRRDRKGAHLPQPIPPISLPTVFSAPGRLTFNGAHLPQPDTLTSTYPAFPGAAMLLKKF